MSNENESQPIIRLDRTIADPLLQMLADNAELDNSNPITVVVTGVIISGMIISAKRYFEIEREKMVASGVTEEVADSWTKMFIEDCSVPLKEGEVLSYLHIENATIIGGQALILDSSPNVRLKIADISAYFWNAFSLNDKATQKKELMQ